MEQLPGILIYLCVAVIVPVALARFVVRAQWRVVRSACLIWYGFLLLAFGALGNAEGFGWALIFAMFFSILAVPIIAAVLTGWRWLGRNNTGAASVGPGRPWMQRFPLSLMSPAQWSLVAVLIAGGFLGSYWYEQRDLAARVEVLRQLLDLPKGTKFAAIQSRASPAIAPRIAATVRLTEPQLRAFAAQLDTAPRWPGGPPKYDGAPVEMIAPETIKWRDVPLPVRAGNHFVNWTTLSAADIRNLRRGRAVCIALQFKQGSSRSTRAGEAPRYAARDCSEWASTDRVAAIAIGALDFDTRTLHVLIN